MQPTLFAAALAVTVINSSTQALRLQSETALTATMPCSCTSDDTSTTTADADNVGVETEWAGPSAPDNGLVSSRGRTTFCLDEENKEASVVCTTITVEVSSLEPKQLYNEVCFNLPGQGNDRCIAILHLFDTTPPIVQNQIFTCNEYDEHFDSCKNRLDYTSENQEQREDGSWMHNTSHNIQHPRGYSDLQISHDPDSNTYEYSMEIPAADLANESAWDSLTGYHYIYFRSEDLDSVRMGTDITAPQPDVAVYSGEDCQAVFQTFQRVAEQQNINVSEVTAKSVKLKPGFKIYAYVNGWEDIFAREPTDDGKIECQTIPASWHVYDKIHVEACNADQIDDGSCWTASTI